MPLDDDYFIQEEFSFSEQGGVIGLAIVSCPRCGAEWELMAEPGAEIEYACSACGAGFCVDWTTGEVSG